jgi:hypothetical protein
VIVRSIPKFVTCKNATLAGYPVTTIFAITEVTGPFITTRGTSPESKQCSHGTLLELDELLDEDELELEDELDELLELGSSHSQHGLPAELRFCMS